MKKRLIRLGVALLGLLALWLAGGHLAAWLYQRHAMQSWEERFGPLADMTARYPRAEDTPAAGELARLAGALGIDFLTREEIVESALPLVEMASYVTGRLEGKPTDPAVAAQVADALDAHADAVAALRAHVLGPEKIRWRADIAAGYEAPIPPLGPHRWLANVLAADALVSDDRGDTVSAGRDVEALWRLTDSLRPRPELITQLVVMVLDMRALRTLQRVSLESAAAWSDRERALDAYDAREGLERALTLEAWMWHQLADSVSVTWLDWGHAIAAADEPDDDDLRPPVVRYLADPLASPFLRLSMANTMLVGQQMVENVATADPCVAAGGDGLQPDVPGWNTIGQIVVPTLMRSYQSALRHALILELTGEVLAAKQARLDGGAWPASGSVPSSVCGDWTWVTETSGDALSIHLAGAPLEPTDTPPLRFQSEPAPRGGAADAG